jgi:hypothetical protein
VAFTGRDGYLSAALDRAVAAPSAGAGESAAAAFCGRVAGPRTMLAGWVGRNICYAPAYTIMGGTTQVLRNVIADRILGLPR